MAVTVQELGPEFGYAADARPLRNERDWAAEQIRIVVRNAFRRESTVVVVEGEDPYLVSVRVDGPTEMPDAVEGAAAALIDAGYLAGRDERDAMALRVWPPSDQMPVVAVARGTARHCRWCGEAMTAVEAAASVAYGWSGRCADCQTEHLATAWRP
ncbi:NAD(+) diphosphatase [Actinomadura montaniterrae]|uniref:Uncharacterized protein n=1 Tax=Actinomadura montaniterrae TaxID=1803903 RepID=A0A6L3VQB2_9ACTN|nr:hypothetical protein [Actinomadura montaniterrae]KAB2375055.1 hypothetical protein F9B16_26865 [Actinomadura montaniterrae]